ncbi:hypothetical protein Y032_0044g909 [Ancylostoma ceylanicum]|uniref:Uncharacterized protein n=1 Tax=Ancylostoma ceylanicum TaxID=53326 RepID=A0A016UEK5_9BILA|nr:hypothetical protein Y032_0044g909 [Ancylostoma ceylanicum]
MAHIFKYYDNNHTVAPTCSSASFQHQHVPGAPEQRAFRACSSGDGHMLKSLESTISVYQIHQREAHGKLATVSQRPIAFG